MQTLAELLAERAIESELVAEGLTLEERVQAMFDELDYHPAQAAYWADESKLMALLGTRRGAKTSGLLRRFAAIAALTPGAHLVYINTTKPEAWRVAWRGANPRDGLFALNERFDLGANPKRLGLRFEFQNGSLIELFGADKPRDFEKALGSAPHVVWLDEAQKARGVQAVIQEILGPAMADYDGAIWMAGTPRRGARDYFYEVTRPCSPLQKSEKNPSGWSLHKVSAFDNPAFGTTYEERYERTVVEFCKKFGLKVTDPETRRIWFMEWADDDALFVYDVHRVPEDLLFWGDALWTTVAVPTPDGGELALEWPDFSAQARLLPKHESGQPKEWLIGLSADLGYDPDPFAINVLAWSYEDPNSYELGSVKHTLLIPDQQVWLLESVRRILSPTYIVGDAGGSNAVVKGWEKGWQNRHPIPIQPAEKSNKQIHQGFVNNDLRTGKLKLLRGSPLHKEMSELMYLELESGKRIENVSRGEHGKKKFPNDSTDALLYNHRQARHFRYQPVIPAPAKGTDEYLQKQESDLEEQALREIEESDDVYFQ